MQEGTSIGLFTVASMVVFGIVFGTMVVLLPMLKDTAMQFMTHGVSTS